MSLSLFQCVCVSHRWSWVRADVAAFPPGHVEAADELQVEGMTAVQHGETQNVGLIIHHVVQLEQREVLQTDRERGSSIFCLSHVMYVSNLLEKHFVRCRNNNNHLRSQRDGYPRRVKDERKQNEEEDRNK